MKALPTRRRLLSTGAAISLAAISVTAVAGCGSSSGSSSNAADTSAAVTSAAGSSSSGSSGSSSAPATTGGASKASFTLWDPYPQFDAKAPWTQLVEKCGTDSGATVKRTGYDTTALTSKALLAAQQGASPNILIVDNPVVSTLAQAGVLTTTADLKLDTSQILPNLLAAGQLDGKTYGVPIGANTLALYYNKKVLSAAGVDPTSVKDWASLTAALAKVKAAGKKGITFSAINTEEGSFQFLPWFWGSGAKLTDLGSPQAVAALQLWTDWKKKGYAPDSVIQNTQTTSWQEFLTGNYAFAENGTWQLSGVKKSGLDWGLLPIPGQNGGTAAAPTGGEFVTVPVQKDKGTYTIAQKIVACLTSGANALTTDTTLSYVAATTAVQQQQVAADPDLTGWVEAVKAAKGRTSDNLGTKYPKISQPMWTAVAAALTGSSKPADALKTAQETAKTATQ